MRLKVDLVYQLRCAIDGVWTDWSHTACSVTCGDGKGIRTRTCTNPEPVGCGETCPANDAETATTACNLGPVST